MFAYVVGGAATFMQLWQSLVGVSTSDSSTEFEPDSNQLMDIEMEEHEMWSKASPHKGLTHMNNNRRMPQPLTEKDRSYIAGIILLAQTPHSSPAVRTDAILERIRPYYSASVLAVTLITIAVVMWTCVL